ncbi:MAG: GNAT family N-acetyltransferase [Gallionella sp.]
MEIIYNLNENHIKQLCELYQQEWWTKGRTLEATKECVSGSQICIGIVDSEELVGFARVITDYTFKAFIFDVIVRIDQRGKGLGGKLVSLIKSHEKLSRVKHFELYCLPELDEFYSQYGFSIPSEIQLMRHTTDAHTT